VLLHVVAPPHPLNAALAVHYALLSGVEGVTLAANFHSQGRLGCPFLKDIAAVTCHCLVVNLGFVFCFHIVLCFT
jgi:hypothetical protein